MIAISLLATLVLASRGRADGQGGSQGNYEVNTGTATENVVNTNPEVFGPKTDTPTATTTATHSATVTTIFGTSTDSATATTIIHTSTATASSTSTAGGLGWGWWRPRSRTTETDTDGTGSSLPGSATSVSLGPAPGDDPEARQSASFCHSADVGTMASVLAVARGQKEQGAEHLGLAKRQAERAARLGSPCAPDSTTEKALGQGPAGEIARQAEAEAGFTRRNAMEAVHEMARGEAKGGDAGLASLVGRVGDEEKRAELEKQLANPEPRAALAAREATTPTPVSGPVAGGVPAAAPDLSFANRYAVSEAPPKPSEPKKMDLSLGSSEIERGDIAQLKGMLRSRAETAPAQEWDRSLFERIRKAHRRNTRKLQLSPLAP